MKVAAPFASKPGDMVSVYSSMYDAPTAVLVCRGVVVRSHRAAGAVQILSQDGVLRIFALRWCIIEPGWE